MYALDVVNCALASCAHSHLLVVVDWCALTWCCWLCTCNWCCQLCTHHLLLLITHTPHSLLLLIVHTHTQTSCYCGFCTHNLLIIGRAHFLLLIVRLCWYSFGRGKNKAFFCVCEVDSIGIVHIRTPLLVIIYIYIYIATYLVVVIGACRTLTLKVLLDNHESMQNNERYDEWKSCLVWNVLSIIVSMNNSLATGDKIPEFYYLNLNFLNENLGTLFHHGSCGLSKIIFCCKFSPICDNNFEKRIFSHNFLVFQKTTCPKKVYLFIYLPTA